MTLGRSTGPTPSPWNPRKSSRAITDSAGGDSRLDSALPAGTYSVSTLAVELRSFLLEAFSPIWVAGEVQRPYRSQAGHLYFELVEKGRGDSIVARLPAVCFRRDRQRVERRLADAGEELVEGQTLRCAGNLDFYADAGRLQLVVRDVDPLFTVGLLARRRRETLAALGAEGLLELNRRLGLPSLPLRLGLVTSKESAAYHDVLSTLRESGYGFVVDFAHSAVQGRAAPAGLRAAIEHLTRRGSDGSVAIDLLLVVRGGGSRSDLHTFDDERLARTIAGAPVPVITGLGHEIDESIADRVAHTHLKTPTKVAEFVVAMVSRAELDLEGLAQRLSAAAAAPLGRASEQLRRAERGLALARLPIAGAAERLRQLSRAVVGLARRQVREEADRLARLERRMPPAAAACLESSAGVRRVMAERLVIASRSRLAQAMLELEGRQRLCRELEPTRVLERGFSLTRRADGRLVRHASEVELGEELRTELASSRLRSRVEHRD